MEKPDTLYIIVNSSKREFLHPHKLGSSSFLKRLLEGKAPSVLAFLLAKRWANDRIVVAGWQSEFWDEARGEYQAKNEELPYKDISLEAREEYEKFTGSKLPKRLDKE